MSREAERYETIKNFRVPDVVDAYVRRPEKLYRKPDEGQVVTIYDLGSFGEQQFSSTDDMLAAVRRALDGN
jgi:hypothetical protein